MARSTPHSDAARAANGYVIRQRCSQNGGCPELTAWRAVGTRSGVVKSIERDVRDEQIRSLLVECDYTIDVLVVRAGGVVARVAAREHLWAIYQRTAYRLGVAAEVGRLRRASDAERQRGEPHTLVLSVVLAWSELRAALPAARKPVARAGQRLECDVDGRSFAFEVGTGYYNEDPPTR